MDPLRVGIVGCGAISGIYLQNLARFEETQVVAVSDLDLERAARVAAQQGIRALEPRDLIQDPEVDLVLNLTVPKAHSSVAMAAVAAGKHVYNEKPLSIEVEEAEALLASAREQGVMVGCAPDTFLGAGIQTCKRIIDEGSIGEPVAAQAFMLSRGHETWHPSPEFYYEQGGGPMLDMGPYYVTALVHLIGRVRRTCGFTRASFPQRTISSQPKAGKVIDVETDTHISGEMEFANGAIGHITTSFDVYGAPLPQIVIYGSEGTLIVPDPNTFGGEPLLRIGHGDFEQVPLDPGYSENSRGLGVRDIALALNGRGENRASGDLALHVLRVMTSFSTASRQGAYAEIADLDA